MEEAVVGLVITEKFQAVDPVNQDVGWSVTCRDPPEKEG